MFDDDLTQFLATPKADALGFRQGVIVAWNTNTGQNTISCAGATLTDVPFMASGGLVLYNVGDVVVLFRQRSSWAILSKVVNPGGIAAIGRNTQAAAAYSATSTNFGTTTSFVTKVQLDIPVPIWAAQGTVQITQTTTLRNSTASTDQFSSKILMPDGAFSSQNSSFVPTVQFATLTIGKAWGAPSTGLVTPSGTLTILGQVTSGAAWAVNASNIMTVDAFVVWNSN